MLVVLLACPGQRTNIFYPYSYRLEQRVKKNIKRKLDCEYHFLFFKEKHIREPREHSTIKPSYFCIFARRDKNSTDIKQK